jgi:hypothetical protein
MAHMLESSSFASEFLGEVFYRGGWLCAAILAIFSIRARIISSIVIWSFLSFTFLFAQRGCWVAASDLGTAWGGGPREYRWNRFNPVLDWPIVANLFLLLALLLLAFHRRVSPQHSRKEAHYNVRKSGDSHKPMD